MQRLFPRPTVYRYILLVSCLLSSLLAYSEGSKDFRDYPGYRLFFNAEQRQQLKVYAAEGETINLGASHVGISGGFMAVYRPDGTLHFVFNGSDGLGTINNSVEEMAGPTGGGTVNGNGYIPATINVGTGQAGIWTVRLEYPTYSQMPFENLLNDAPWNRNDQSVEQRVVLAWDITVSQNAAVNRGGTPVEGRVYSNEYISIQNGNDITTSPSFYILTKDGFQYKIDFMDTDPWGFPIFSNSAGLITPEGLPCYQSLEQSDYNRSGLPLEWTSGNKYLYEPQAEDLPSVINNKIFFNPPDANMPATALVTDMLTFNTHTTWLYRDLEEVTPDFQQIGFQGIKDNNSLCKEATTVEVGTGANINFTANVSGTAKISLDFNNNGQFDDAADRTYFQRVEAGKNTLYWDGKNGEGTAISAAINFTINYKIEFRAGEIHIMMLDVENNPGGVQFTRLNGFESPSNEYYYDHSAIGGPVSGNGTSGNAQVTTEPFTYSDKFGNNRLLDYWTYIEYPASENGRFVIDIIGDCSQPVVDTDGDGVPDFVDLDDDNDGITDFSEYCNPEGDYVCLPGGVNPSGDADNDNIPNYADNSDPSINNDCQDANKDGICDVLNARYDTDGDGIPDHLDLDSDNDGITDLVEAGHAQMDANGDGVIDGDASFFGQNGLFNALASEPNEFTAFENYDRLDSDGDGVPDHDDLDSDNDGIHDVAETLFGQYDSNNDGRIDDENGAVPLVNKNGLVPIIDPEKTGVAIPSLVDTDLDGVPDWHDLDSDNDGINDVAEARKLDSDEDGIIGSDELIVNVHGQAVKSEENQELLTTSQPTNSDKTDAADFRSLDADADGIFDVNEANQPDGDRDGLLGTGRQTVNAKGQITMDSEGNSQRTLSILKDTDEDEIADFQDVDRDGDGILDQYECPNGWPCVNSDDDDLLDIDDLDSDNDALLDKEECPGGFPCADTDNNTIGDFLEYTCHPRNTPQPTQATGGGQFCAGVPVALNAQGDSNFTEMLVYQWTGPNDFEFVKKTRANTEFPLTLPNTQKEASGTYQLTLETAKGCQSEPLAVTVNLREKPETPNLSVAKAELCAGDALELSANSFSGDSVTYIWYKQTDGNPSVVATTSTANLLVETATVANSGQYTVEVSVNGCASNVSNAEVVQVRTPIENLVATSSATILNPACEGETVQLSVPFKEGAMYEWAGPNNFTANQSDITLNNASFLNNGNYNALVTFEGCSVRTNDVTVMVNPKPLTPTLKMLTEKQCEGADATLKIIEPVSYPNNENVQFSWYTIGQNTPINTTDVPTLDLLNLAASSNGDYYVEVDIAGCTSAASNVQNIEIQPKVVVNASSSATQENPACSGEMVMLTGTLFDGATYAWNGPNGLISDKPSTAFVNAQSEVNGTYTLSVTLDGCTSTSESVSVKVNPKPTAPTIVLDNTEPCTGENISIRINNSDVTLAENEVKVDWYNVDNEQIVTTTEDLIWRIEALEDIDAGEYYAVLTVNNCASEKSNVQKITTQPGLAKAEIITNAEAGINPICEGEQVRLSVPLEADVNYQWFDADDVLVRENNELIIHNAPTSTSGTYYLVREKAGCTRRSESVNVQVSKMPQTPELIIEETVLCFGGNATFKITNPQEISGGNEVTYSWYNVQTNEPVGTSTHPIFTLPNLTEADNGNYYVVLTVDGCTTAPSNLSRVAVQMPTVEFVATASAGLEAPVCEGETVSLNVPFAIGATYEWYGPNGFTATVPNPSISDISLADTGNYYAVVTSGLCPVLTDAINLKVKSKPDVPNLMVDNVQKCEGDELTLAITKPTVFPTGSDVSYQWYNVSSDVPLATTTEPIFNQENLTSIGDNRFYAQVTQNGCDSDLSNEVELEISAIPDEMAFIMENSATACDDRAIRIEAIQPMLGTGQWTASNNLTFVDPLNPSTLLVETPEGDHTIYWTLSYKGCKNYAQDSLTVRQAPSAITATDDEFTVAFNDKLEQENLLVNDMDFTENELTVKLMSEPQNGLLTFENGTISYEPNTNFFGIDAFEYEICSNNCPDKCDQAEVRVNVVDAAVGDDCFVPNVITPNNDGRNDAFRVPCVANQPQSQLKVFNRWGDLVYESDNYENDWTGTYNGDPLPNGTYFYLLKMSGSPAEPMQGYFSLVR
ncbi:MAG: gliding motility-associated C-terminal domain-containing protein [Bacteroidota bacterium]